MFGFDVRESGGAIILMLVAFVIIWVAFTGRLSNVLGSILTPGQMVEAFGNTANDTSSLGTFGNQASDTSGG